MIKVSTTGMAVSLKTDLRFPISGQWGHGDRIIQTSTTTAIIRHGAVTLDISNDISEDVLSLLLKEVIHA